MSSDTPQPTHKPSALYAWMVLLIIGATWGSSYYFMKKGLEAFSYVQVGAFRIAVTSICFLPFLPRALKRIKPRQWRYLLVVGFCGSGIPALLFPLAQTRLSSSFTGVMSSTTPIFTLAVGAVFFGLQLSRNKVLGVLIGFMGALLLILFSGAGALEGDPLYALLICIATTLYAFSSNTVNRFLGDVDTISISTAAFTMLGLPAFGILWFTDFASVVREHPQAMHSMLHILGLAVMGTVLASVFFFQLIKVSGVIFASTISYVIPCFALLLGFLDGEPLIWVHGAGMVLILIGVYLTSIRS